MRLGALEAGGTKMVLAVGNEKGEIFEMISMPTKTPKETVPPMIKWFKEQKIEALGIGAFGPVDVNEESKTYGSILDTPKLAWVRFNLIEAMRDGMEDEDGSFLEGLKVPMKIDTDVNGSCLGEMTFGAAKGLDSVLYLTVGTGVGAGIAIGGRLLHGMLHPEAGHILLDKHKDDKGSCVCPYHDNCLEGLAAGPSLEARWGKKGIELVDMPEVWELESHYLAKALVNYILTVSPKRIILGGGVMHQKQLFPLIREKVKSYLGGYIKTEELENLDEYIVPNSLDDLQGVLGAIELARLALEKEEN